MLSFQTMAKLVIAKVLHLAEKMYVPGLQGLGKCGGNCSGRETQQKALSYSLFHSSNLNSIAFTFWELLLTTRAM